MTLREIQGFPMHGPVPDHPTEGLVDDSLAGHWSGPLDLSKKDDVLEMERARSLYADLIEGQPSDQQIHQRIATARGFIGQFVKANHELFIASTEPENIIGFGNWRIDVADRGIPSLPEETLFQARAAVRKLAKQHGPSVRAKLLAIPPSVLVDHRNFWIVGDVWHPVPSVFQTACEELSLAIAREVIGRIMRSGAVSLQGHVQACGLGEAHVLVDPGRWAPYADHLRRLQAKIIDAAGWVSSATVRVAGES
jgi:hypothetical protein